MALSSFDMQANIPRDLFVFSRYGSPIHTADVGNPFYFTDSNRVKHHGSIVYIAGTERIQKKVEDFRGFMCSTPVDIVYCVFDDGSATPEQLAMIKTRCYDNFHKLKRMADVIAKERAWVQAKLMPPGPIKESMVGGYDARTKELQMTRGNMFDGWILRIENALHRGDLADLHKVFAEAESNGFKPRMNAEAAMEFYNEQI